MGRPRRLSGATAIANAEELFRQSVAAKKPDYSLVALAIGENPFSPPAWAMLECIELRGERRRAAMRGYDSPSAAHATRNILDEIVRFYLNAEQEHKKATGFSAWETGIAPEMKYKVPRLRQAIIAACLRLGTREDNIGDASNDWHRDIRDAWDWEQENDALEPKASGSGVPSPNETYHELCGWKVTSRIERVIEELTALECGFPADIEKALWILREMGRHKMP